MRIRLNIVRLQDMATELLSKDELQRPRSARAFRAWVDRVIDALAADPDLKLAARQQQDLMKSLFEEVRPLALFAHHHFNSSCLVTLQYVMGDQPYDGVVLRNWRWPRSKVKFIEVTQAHEGEAEHLRMLALKREGHVNALGPVHKTGTKATGINLKHEDVRGSVIDRIVEAVERKQKKTYPEGTALVVSFDDSIAVQGEADRTTLNAAIMDRCIPALTPFCLGAFVGGTRGTYFEHMV